MTSFSLLLLVIFVTLVFEFSNGWHDAANSIATVVSTRVLTPFRAVLWAAFFNFIAAFWFGTAVAKTITKGLVRIEMIDEKVILAGLLGAIAWNLITLILGLPTSSSHALIAGYGGAAIAHAGSKAIIFGGWIKPVLFIFLAPVIGLFVGMTVTILTSWIVHRQRPLKVDRWFRRLQLLSAAGYSLGHGTNDAQKGMGIITAALVAGGLIKTFEVPYWVIICCHLAMGGGTMAGVGASRRLTAVRWGVTRRIVWAWVLTIPGAALIGTIIFHLLKVFLPATS